MTRTTGWVWSSLFFVLLAVSLTPAALVPSVKPEAEHQRLGYFVGKWTGSGQIRPGPMGPGGRFTSTDTCEWFDGGFAVVCRTEGTIIDNSGAYITSRQTVRKFSFIQQY
jgi:hypothetical protein